MSKSTKRGLFGRAGVLVIAAVLLITLIPMNVTATDSSKNTTAITPVIGGATEVYTPLEFQRAAADARVSTIVLRNNIVFEDFQYFERRTESNLTIDGADRYYLAVLRSGSCVNPLAPSCYVSLEFKGYYNLTFQNIGLSGEAFNAFVYSQKQLNLTFDNVTFSGPSLAYVNGCLSTYGMAEVLIKDSDITLRSRVPDSRDISRNCYLYPSSAVRIGYGNIVLSGDVNIQKLSPISKELDNEPVFAFRVKKAGLYVEPNANVNIVNESTASGSAHWSALMENTCCSLTTCLNHDLKFIVGRDAKFYYEGEGGTINEGVATTEFRAEQGSRVDMIVGIPRKTTCIKCRVNRGSYFTTTDFTVMPSAEVNVIVKYDTLYAREAVVGLEHLMVNEDATLRIVTPDNETGENALRFHGKNPSMYIDRPDLVLFYNGHKLSNSKSPSRALSSAVVGDCCYLTVCSHHCTKDIDFKFVGAGIRTWEMKDDPIPIERGTWIVDPEKSTTWSTGRRALTYTFTATIAKKDLQLLNPIVYDPGGYLTPIDNPAHPITGLKTFNDKSVVEFNGSSAPKIVKMPIEYYHVYIHRSEIFPAEIDEAEGNGVDPIVYDIDPDRYLTPIRFLFNLNERSGYTGLYNVGTVDNLPSSASIAYDPATGHYTLTVYPVAGVYETIKLFYAAKTTDIYYEGEPGEVEDPVNPDYWYYSEN